MDWDPSATATDGYVCPPCPVFHPTQAEFQHPLKYISSIRHIGMQAGICKIVPPAGWQPPFAINEKTFRFRTRVQQLNCIDGHTRAEGNFVEALRMFLYRNGTPMQELPRVDGGQLLNLQALHKTVVELGGYENVCAATLWSQVVRRVGRTRASDRPSLALCQQYQHHYETCLLAYERRDDPRFQTPNAAATKKKVASTNGSAGSTTTPSDKNKSGSEKKQPRATVVDDHGDGDESMLSPNSKRVKRTLFSDGGNTSSEESDALAARAKKTRMAVKTQHDSELHQDEEMDDDAAGEDDDDDEEDVKRYVKQVARKSAAELEPRALKPDARRKQRLDPPEIDVGQKFYHYVPDHGAKIGEVQRVVRGKKPHVVVKYVDDGSRDTIDLATMQLIVANGWSPDAAEVAFKSELCQTCLRGDCWDQLLLCDSCNGGHHLFCLDEPLTQVPSGDWYCASCVEESLLSTKESNPKFGFEMGSEYTLAAYKEKADNWKSTYFGTNTDDEADQISDRDLEREYWRILSTPLHEQRLEVEYGSDIDSGAAGSGFPRADECVKIMKVLAKRLRILSDRKGATPTQKKLCELFSRGLKEALTDGSTTTMEELLEKYALDDWNLNNLPKMSGSVLQHLDEDIKGVMVPWIYIGMCFSTFCWHVEDHNFYSISYLHRGAPKTWYGVPCAKAEYFESVMKKLTPELFGSQPDLHLQLVTMFSPETLVKHGVPVYRATHRANEFMVTFPSAYHGGFNNGFNCAEAVNFATVDWLPWGAKSVLNYRNFCKLPVFAHEALVVSLAETVLESHAFNYESTKSYFVPAVMQLVKERTDFEASLESNSVIRRETMAEYARRHGMMEGDAGDASASGTHSRSCKMMAKRSGILSPERIEEPSGGMKTMGARAPGTSKMQSKMMATRPARMVLWAGTSGKSEGLRCSTCKQYCYLQAVVCTKCRHHSSVGCMDHYPTMCKCDAAEHYLYVYRYDRGHLQGVLEGLERRLRPVDDWLVDLEATLVATGKPKVLASMAKKLQTAGLQCGGVPQDKLDDLEAAIAEAARWTEAADRLMNSASMAETFPSLARLMGDSERLQLIPDLLERVEACLGEWGTCRQDAQRLVDVVSSIQHAESLSMAFDFERDSQRIDALWKENEGHLDVIRRLVDVSERAHSIGQPLPQPLADRSHAAKQYLRVLIAANEMLAVIARFTTAKTQGEPSPMQGAGTRSTPPPPPKPLDVAVIMERDCRRVTVQADMLETNLQLSIFKIKVLRSLLRVTEVEAEDLHHALDDYSKSFEELDSLWRRLRALPICPDRLDELGKRLSLCKSWEHRAKKIVDAVAVSRSGSAGAARPETTWDDVLARPSLQDLERFYEDAERHFVPVSSFVRRQLHARLQDCRRWYTSMHALFVRAPVTHESPTLQHFMHVANDKIPMTQRMRPAAMQLYCVCDQVLSEQASVVDCVRCKRLFHTQCVGQSPASPTPFCCLDCRQPPAPQRNRTVLQYPPLPYQAFCLCRGPEGPSMICCDVCDEWYHAQCVGLSADELDSIEAFRCPRCAVRQNLYYLDRTALRRGALGRRPAVSRVEALLVQLQTALVAVPAGTRELLQYLHHVKDVETRVQRYVAAFASDFSVASFSSLDYRAEEQTLVQLMRDVTSLEVHLESAIGNLSAIHWSLRACELVLGCDRAPKYSHLVVLLEDARTPSLVFPRAEYRHIQQTIEDRVMRAMQWLQHAKTLQQQQQHAEPQRYEANRETARRLADQYHELAQFLELPAAEVELVFHAAGQRMPPSRAMRASHGSGNGRGNGSGSGVANATHHHNQQAGGREQRVV